MHLGRLEDELVVGKASDGPVGVAAAPLSGGGCTPLTSRATAEELTRVLAYPKFRLSAKEWHELRAEYVVHCETVRHLRRCPVTRRDPGDQPFLDLAYGGDAAVLVTGDEGLLALSGHTRFTIESAGACGRRVLEE